MAAAEAQLPEQLDMIGVEPAAGPDISELLVACSGVVKHAEVRVSTDNRPHLVVRVLQPRGGLPFVAMYHGEPGTTPELERMVQRLLRPGAIALLRGRGLRLSPYARGEMALHLVDCMSVSELEVSPAPAARADAEASDARA